MIRISDIYNGGDRDKKEEKHRVKEEKKEQKLELEKEKKKIGEKPKKIGEKPREEKKYKDIEFEKEKESSEVIEEFNIEQAEVVYNQGILLLREMFDNVKSGKHLFPQGLLEVIRWFKDNLKEKGEILFFIFEDTPSYYLIAHSLNVAIISMKMLLDLGKDELEMLASGVAGLVHDVGLVNLMQLISQKKKFSPTEYAFIKEHSIRSYEVVKNMEGLGEATKKFILPIVRYHHERFNGRGYPEGLIGNSIPFHARLFGLVDVFESLSHERPYRKASSPAVSVQKLIQLESEGWFDYSILRDFIESFSFYPVGSKVKLNTDEIAIVVRSNKGQPTRPVVRIMEGENKGKIKDLLKDPLAYIKEGLK